MDETILNILAALREGDLSQKELDRIIRTGSKRLHDGRRRIAKKHVLPRYLHVRNEGGDLWRSWDVDDELHERFVKTLQMKPRRTASGVATITVITKPWPCSNSCVYCPNDPRMPKSYLSDEPACQRAERNLFHPYLQVASRLRTLHQMGHATDKVELIVLGGTWLDYPRDYRFGFTALMFKALNDTAELREEALSSSGEFASAHPITASPAVIEAAQRENEASPHRVVGLVFETRPDTITPEALHELRALGCTKVQIGVQSIRDDILEANGRRETEQTLARSFELCRLFGFKIHAHFMLNLLKATPETDRADYRRFCTDERYRPDEVKLYPCALVAGTELVDYYQAGEWKPYSEEELLETLCDNLAHTPAYMRVSRMIRDISAHDIMVGNKKTNLRQLVEERAKREDLDVHEIRFREIGTERPDMDDLVLDEMLYHTTCSQEAFLQWVDHDGRIVGFLRLSLPDPTALQRYEGQLPIGPGEAMIREVHVYGFATHLDKEGTSAQHRGLGRSLIERACDISKDAGYTRVNVISAVGTRAYYRKCGFADHGLYQQREL